MKTLKGISLLTIIAMFIVFNSCTKEDEIAELNENAVTIEKQGMEELPGLDQITAPLISEPSPDADMAFINDGMPLQLAETFNGQYIFHIRKKIILSHLFDTLNLSKEQMEKVKYAMTQHHKCRFQLQFELRKLNHEILKKANEQKAKLIRKFQAGDITKPELERALKELHHKTIAALRDNQERKQLIENLKRCHQNYIENIRLILNKQQWDIFVDFHKRLQNSN